MTSCLLLIDLQNDYFPGGTMELVASAAAAANARRLLDRFRADGAPIVHIQHLAARPEATFFLPGTSGAEIYPALAPADGEAVITKHFPNSFRDTALLATLQQLEVRELTICGAMSHMCVDATVRAAYDLGFSCTVAADACATRDLLFDGRTVVAADVHAAFMAALAVPYATVTTTAALLKERS